MRAPAFWWRPDKSPAALVLGPTGRIYGAVTAARMRRAGTKLPVPVICIGNLVAGGAGKTPTAMALAALLRREGLRPAFLSRGYGRKVSGSDDVLKVDPTRHDASMAGDEPLLLSAVAPTYVARDRVEAGRKAVAEGADVLLLDDGLQNPALHKSFALAVVDGASGIGNGACVPAGPLRAPLPDQWPHVSAACIIGLGEAGDHVASLAKAAGKTVFRATLQPDPTTVEALRDQPLFAFSGIGRPQKFLDTLRQAGLDLVASRDFPDHHAFSAAELSKLQREADRLCARLVTTAKDKVRLPPDFPAEALPVSLQFDDARALLRDIMAAMATHAL